MFVSKTKKLYCYVDETGQDTKGQFFIVAVVVTGGHRDELERLLEQIEQASGKKKRKWRSTRLREREAYILGLSQEELASRIYVHIFNGSGSYEDLEILATAQALNLYREHYGIGDNYKVTIAIDGLAKGLTPKVGRSLRLLGVKTRNVHGERDQSSPITRLADAVAGLVRESHEGRTEYQALQRVLEAKRVLHFF